MNEIDPVLAKLNLLGNMKPGPEATERALAKTEAAIVDSGPAAECRRRELTMPRTLAAGILFAASIAAVWLTSSMSRQVALGQVMSNLDKVKSIQYRESRTDFMPGRKLRGPTEVTKVTILGRYRQRREFVSATGGDKLPDGGEWTSGTPGVVGISNLETGEFVTLDTNAKTFSVTTRFLAIDRESGKLIKSKPTPVREADLYQELREFPEHKAQRLKSRKIGEGNAAGFRIEQKNKKGDFVDKWTRTIWVDEESKLPVRIEILFHSTHPQSGEVECILSDFVFDEPIDESLLSTQRPEGFRVIEH